MSSTDLSVLLENVDAHKQRLSAAREAVVEPIQWYLYDILGNLSHLDALLPDEHRDLGELVAGGPVADIGGADGDLAFALEHEWDWQVDLIDTASTNMNGLEGARKLRDQLGSKILIEDIDLDSQFRLPRKRYGLVFFLGILYHLQNPYFALRQLAEQADYCIVSTKVARCFGSQHLELADLPVGYLLGPAEANNDPTNYWIFSPAGLERLVTRTGWDVMSRYNVGDTAHSDPATPEHDERMFMLLRSRTHAN